MIVNGVKGLIRTEVNNGRFMAQVVGKDKSGGGIMTKNPKL